MSASLLLVWAIAFAAAGTVAIMPDKSFSKALGISWRQALRVTPIVLPAIIAAGFLAALLPESLIAEYIGSESGVTGVLAASLIGAVIPTGPMVVMPIAAALLKAGGGVPQICALVSAWSIMNLHRLFLWELPMLGGPFTWRRFATGLLLAPLTACVAQLILLVG